MTESSRSLLDVILASQTKQVVKADMMDSSISDHDMVFAILHLKVASFRFEDDDEIEDQVQLLLIVRMLKSVTVMA